MCTIRVAAGQAAASHLCLVPVYGWGLLGPYGEHDSTGSDCRPPSGQDTKLGLTRTRLEVDHWPLQFSLSPQPRAALAKLPPGVAVSALASLTPPPYQICCPHPGSQQKHLPSRDIIMFCNMIGI